MLHFPLFAAIALSFAAPPAPAVDLEKIDQPIRKEPAYQSKAPKYCLVVFGPNAETRVWVVLDGETLYVDKNGNGDLTEAGEQLKVTTPNQDPASFSEVEIGTEGKTKPKLNAAVWGWLNRNHDPKRELEVTLSATVADGRRFVAWGDEKSPLKFAARPAEAPIVHFGGPLMMGLEIRSPLTRKSADTFELNMAVGCKGRGPGAFAAMIYTPVPKDAYPRVVFEFPAKSLQDPPIKVETLIKERCWGVRFHDTVRVPGEIGNGKVRVTISFENWKEGHVGPATFELALPAVSAKAGE